jgi:hypothetical protein
MSSTSTSSVPPTPELITERVLEALSLEAVEKGVAHMTAEVARPTFTNEKGLSTVGRDQNQISI